MPDVLRQDVVEMPLADDQHVVQALAAQRSCEPLGVSVRSRRPDRRPDHPRAVPGEDLVEFPGELAVPVADQEPEAASPLAEVHQEAAGLLGGPGPLRMSGDARDVHRPGLDLHHEQDINALEQHGIDVKEVAGEDAGDLGGQELPPGRRGPPRRRPQPGGSHDPADRRLPNPVP
jgi:hypothetical protein